MSIPKTKGLTHTDYLQLPDDGNRYEIIDGDLYVTPSPVESHQRTSFLISLHVGGWIEQNGLGRFYAAPLDVVLSHDTVVQPDHLFVAKHRVASVVERWIHGAPDLAIEILSPSTAGRDQVTKRDSYARKGIREYWLVDPIAQTVTVLVLQGKRYHKVGMASGSKRIPSHVLEGLPVKVSDLFA